MGNDCVKQQQHSISEDIRPGGTALSSSYANLYELVPLTKGQKTDLVFKKMKPFKIKSL